MPKKNKDRDGFIKIDNPYANSDSESEPFQKLNIPNHGMSDSEDTMGTDTDASYGTAAELSEVEEPEFEDPEFAPSSKTEINKANTPAEENSESEGFADESDMEDLEETNVVSIVDAATYRDSHTDLSRKSICAIHNTYLYPRQRKQAISEHIIARTLENKAGSPKAMVFSMSADLDNSNTDTIEAQAARKAFEDMRKFLFGVYSTQLKLFGTINTPRLVLFAFENKDAILTTLKNKQFEKTALVFFKSQVSKAPASTTVDAAEIVAEPIVHAQ